MNRLITPGVREVTFFPKEQMPFTRVLTLVFVPALLILLFYLGLSLTIREHIPVFLCLLLAIAFVLVPFQLVVIGNASKREHGKYGLQAAFSRHEPMTTWKLGVKSFMLLSWAGLIFSTVQTHENEYLLGSVFKFVPDFLNSTTYIDQLITYPKWIIVATCILNLIFNGLLGPIVEELYFRGYIMSRMEHLGKAAPFIVAILFSLYHLFTPWENLTRILAVLPYHYFVWKDKNLYIGILVHCTCNLIGCISMFSLVLK